MFGTVETIFVVFSCLSGFCSFSVLLTVLVFPTMRRRGFIQMIICISLSEFVASVVSAFGFPRDSSALCPIQSFFTLFSYKCSWVWTTALCHQLHNVIVEGKYGLSMLQMHIICWGIPLVSTLLPLVSTEYGRDDDTTFPLGWCFLEGKATAILLWTIFSFYLTFFVCLLVMTYYLVRLHIQFRGIDLKTQHPDVYVIYDAMKLYPLGMALAWSPNIVCSMIANSGYVPDTASFGDIYNSLTILATQDGTITALIFFLKSKEAQFRWKALLWGLTMEDERLSAQFDNDDMYDSLAETSRSSFADQRLLTGGSMIKRVHTNNTASSGGGRLDSAHRSNESAGDNAQPGWSRFPKQLSWSSASRLTANSSDINSEF
jgi:hypothetical protein